MKRKGDGDKFDVEDGRKFCQKTERDGVEIPTRLVIGSTDQPVFYSIIYKLGRGLHVHLVQNSTTVGADGLDV